MVLRRPTRQKQKVDTAPPINYFHTVTTDTPQRAHATKIKNGRNADIVKHCETLRGYAIFTDMIRENHRQKMSPEASIRKAVDDCINQNVLKTFLKKHKQEVVGMLLTEWNLDTALAVREEEGVEKGRETERLRTVRAMKEKGADIHFIAEVTELPIDTILKL